MGQIHDGARLQRHHRGELAGECRCVFCDAGFLGEPVQKETSVGIDDPAPLRCRLLHSATADPPRGATEAVTMATLNPVSGLQGSLFPKNPPSEWTNVELELLIQHVARLEALIHRLTEHLIQLDLRMARL